MGARREVTVEVEGRPLVLSNLDKVFYPESGFTKGDVVEYYRRAAPALLPHLHGRPLTLKRYPDGAPGPYFYEKRCPRHRPDWVETAEVARDGGEEPIRFCVVNDLPALMWAANLASLELHTALHRAPDVLRPTALVLDLDPGPPADLVLCCELALLIRRIFDRLSLQLFPKTSGSKGLQLYVPLDATESYDATKLFARALAERLAASRGDLVVSSMKKALRAGKVLVDWSQNDRSKTTVSVWSLRARERPTVSAPVTWEEVARTARRGLPGELSFEAHEAIERYASMGDVFAPVESLRQKLPPVELLHSAIAAVLGGGPGDAEERFASAGAGESSPLVQDPHGTSRSGRIQRSDEYANGTTDESERASAGGGHGDRGGKEREGRTAGERTRSGRGGGGAGGGASAGARGGRRRGER